MSQATNARAAIIAYTRRTGAVPDSFQLPDLIDSYRGILYASFYIDGGQGAERRFYGFADGSALAYTHTRAPLPPPGTPAFTKQLGKRLRAVHP